ncbi:unnamed protein product [Staurois parvus]|uniref:Secreted protein n=1 Tax=Staurois parvus TaxID=386267 RepID=A0ABN9D2I7_9NEOB|nr:unnamed protein product [Staurois parvus]
MRSCRICCLVPLLSSASWQQSHQHSWQQSHKLPGSNLISFTQLQLWLVKDAFTPGCLRILSSHGPFFQYCPKHGCSLLFLFTKLQL